MLSSISTLVFCLFCSQTSQCIISGTGTLGLGHRLFTTAQRDYSERKSKSQHFSQWVCVLTTDVKKSLHVWDNKHTMPQWTAGELSNKTFIFKVECCEISNKGLIIMKGNMLHIWPLGCYALLDGALVDIPVCWEPQGEVLRIGTSFFSIWFRVESHS